MANERRIVRCAIYTRKSSDEGLEQEFNSLDAQFEACLAYLTSQRGEGWKLAPGRYDDGGFSGGTLERPALARLMADIDAGRIDMVIVYKIDRLTRSLMDFSKLVERLDQAKCSFVSVTQSFNTATSMGRLVLNVLLSFAQFEREVTAERIRDKIAASKKKGIWMGGVPPFGYLGRDRQLVIDDAEAAIVRQLFDLYLEHRCIVRTKQAADRLGLVSRPSKGRDSGLPFSRGGVHWLLTNPVYVGEIRHGKLTYPGLHQPIIERSAWDEVQAQLTSRKSGTKRGGSNIRSRSLLVGKIVDETGSTLSPSHAGSHDRRHRYYVSQPLLEGRKSSSHNGGWRLPGDHLERTVSALVLERLGSQSASAKVLTTITDTRTLAQVGGEADDQPGLLDLVEQVRIAPQILEIKLERTILAARLETEPEAIAAEFLEISAPFQTRRRGVETRLLIGDDPMMIDPVLLKLVARGTSWWQAILAGKTIAQIAREEGVCNRQITSHLPAAFIAPDILERIVDGRQPPLLTASWLRNTDLPMLWEDQRRMLGLPATSAS